MKYLIIYDSKTGCTEDCANYIQSKLNDSKIVKIKEIKEININDYNHFLIGSPIYIGNPRKSIIKFCQKNINELLNKDISFFFCGARPKYEENENGIKNSISNELLTIAKAIDYFGGELRYDKMNFFERFIMKKIQKEQKIETEINYKKIDEFIKLIEE